MRTLSVLFGSEDREDRTSVNSLRELSSQNVLAVRGIKRGIRGLFFYCNLKGPNHSLPAHDQNKQKYGASRSRLQYGYLRLRQGRDHRVLPERADG